jgi:hypothetical protein
MVEKTRVSQGASVSKTGNASVQSSSVPKSKLQWEPNQANGEKHLEACQDNSRDDNASDGDKSLQAAKLSPRSKKPVAKQEISEQIGRQLRSVYNDVLAQPVPDRFLDLLRALEKDPK